jgi:hypothetical protein
MGELNLDKIERTFENEHRPDILQLLHSAPKSLQLVNCSPETCKNWIKLLEENDRIRSKVHL